MVVIKNDIVYDKTKELKTDIYYPNDTSSNTKILIFWHGGGWFRGDKESVKNLGIRFANAGFMTFIPDYSLAPKYHFPAAHEDALHFVDWLLNSEYTDQDDVKNIVQIGASVGGEMAIEVAGKYGFPTVTWSAPVEYSNWIKNHQDTKASPDAANDFGITDPEKIRQSFYKYFTLTYTGTQDEAVLQKLDAKSFDYSHLKQLMMINSADELTHLATVLDFVKFLADKNLGVQLLVIPGHGHAMAYGPDYVDESLDFLYQTIKRQD